MIEAKNLRKVYKTKKGVVVNALDGVSVKLPDTGMVFILGKSGSGKSTLLNVLGGLDSFDSGEIIIKGSSAKDFKQSHYDSYRNTYIGFIFQEYNVLEELTVGANVALAIELQGRRATDEEINSILAEVDLGGFGARKPNELSGGQKQRVAIARALVKKPEIIMADEPTGALDSATGKQVFDTLKKLSRDKLVLIVSHDREFSEQYADRIIELKDGVIISDVEKLSDGAVTDDVPAAEEAMTFGEGEISLVPGYKLTEEDRLAINEYLDAYAKGAVIKVKSKEKKKVSSGDFIPTDESKIKSHKQGDFQLIKSKLSMKNAFKLGSGGLKHKKFRLVFTIFLSLISFTLFGLADTIAAYDNIATATSSIYDTGVDYASFIKEIKQGSDDYEYWSEWNTSLSPDDVETIKTQTGYNVVGVYKKDSQLSFSQNLGKNSPEGMNPKALYRESFSGITAISNAVLNEYGFKLLAGNLPAADKNEILITKYAYDFFAKVGHVEFDKEGKTVETELKSENDIVGKTLTLDMYYNGSNVYTVSGVVDVNFDYTRYEPLADNDAQYKLSAIELMALQSELEAAQSYSFACMGFVSEKMMSDILADAANKPETLNNANFSYYLVNDDSMEDTWDIYGEDGSNVISSQWFNSVYSFEKVKDKVLLFNDYKGLTELADNQIIISSSYLTSSLVSSDYPEAWYNIEALQGDERLFYQVFQSGYPLNGHPSLESIMRNTEYYYAYKYASDNTDAARAVIQAFHKMSDEDMQNNFQDKYQVCHTFAQIVSESGTVVDGVDTGVTVEAVLAYRASIISRYDLEKYMLPNEWRPLFYAEYEYNGVKYLSYDISDYLFTRQFMEQIDRLIGCKYAAENLDDAIRYYTLYKQETHPEGVEFVFNIEEAVTEYGDYVSRSGMMHIGGKGESIDFTPSPDAENYDMYKAKILVNFYEEKTEGKPILSVEAYSSDYRAVIKDAKIVGVYVDTNQNKFFDGMYYGGNTAVVSENLMSKLLGANRGGLYSFAVGKMPADKGGINELVRFSKTYMNEAGDVRYSLSNNVTTQLNMVDELLEVLGQVFLYVGLGFALFASLMLTNFISTSITHKKQEIGILRAIGSRSSDVFRIFFAESFIIAMINYVLSVAGTLSVTIVLNNVLRNDAGILITFLNFGVRQVGLLLGVSLLVAFIATFFPVKKIASMKPIDAIKNRK